MPTSRVGPVCSPRDYDAYLDRGCGEPGRAVDLNSSVAVFTILPGPTDTQMEGKLIADAELRTLKAAAVILSLLTGIWRGSGANRLGAAEILSKTFR